MKYNDRLEKEIKTYKEVEIIHQLPPIHGYWGNKYLYPKLKSLGYKNFKDLFVKYIKELANKESKLLSIISIGAGNCDFEVTLANELLHNEIHNFLFLCIEINSEMLKRGEEKAQKVGLKSKFRFLNEDFNSWQPKKEIDIVIGNQSLHHVTNLENLFSGIKKKLNPNGYFLINDMIGRNGHMRWPESEYFINLLWQTLEKRHQYNWQHHKTNDKFVNWDCSTESFEGIRAQDILPLLSEMFHFTFFLPFASIISPFIGRSYGKNFDVRNPNDLKIIDNIATLDERLIESGILTPTQMFAVLSHSKIKDQHIYKNLTPAFCVRNPNEPPPFYIMNYS